MTFINKHARKRKIFSKLAKIEIKFKVLNFIVCEQFQESAMRPNLVHL